MSDSNCIICFEALSSAPIGAAVPCGHCFHQECFQQWKASSSSSRSRGAQLSVLARQVVTCPMCNANATFTNLFIDLKVAEDMDDGDDDDSLSSASSSETDDVHQHDRHKTTSSEAVVALNNAGESTDSGSDCESGAAAREESQEQQERQNEDDETYLRPDVIEIDILEDDDSVIDILSDDGGVPPCASRQSRCTQKESHAKKDRSAYRLRRKAKHLKKQNKFLESQRNEILERERKFLDDLSKARKRLKEAEQELETHQEEAKVATLELAGHRVKSARLTRERDNAIHQLKAAQEKAAHAEASLQDIQQRCRRDVEEAQAAAMQEVKSMVEQQPILVQENHTLKELMAKKDQQLSALKQKVESLKVCAQDKDDTQVRTQHRASSTKQAKSAARAYQAAREQRLQQQQDEARARKQARAAANKVPSRPSKSYSSQATRMLKVASKQRSAMQILGAASRRRVDGEVASSSAGHRQQRRKAERQVSIESDGSAVLEGVSLNVSFNAKRRKIESFQAGAKRGTSNDINLARKKTNMTDFFGRNPMGRR